MIYDRRMFMKIALYGIGGLYNYGCEAIIRGTVSIIRQIAPNVQIVYYSKRADEDKLKIIDLGIKTIQLKMEYSIVSVFLNWIGRRINLPYRFGESSFKQIVDNSDMIVSIGGDIYTIPKYIYSKRKYPYYKSLVQFGEYVLRKNKKLIIFGASIGPFGEYGPAKNYFFNHLKKVDLIVARENRCINYLKDNSIEKNVYFMPDPAFFVEFSKKNQDSYEYIGINLSPLSLLELYGERYDKNLKYITTIIESIAVKSGLPILLIPHVISPICFNDNDLIFMENIYCKLNLSTQKVTSICEPNGFLEAKSLLRKCRVVVAARMHCAINAVSEGTPTIFLTYSEKAKGMARFIYGDDRWQIPLEEIEDRLVNMVHKLLKDEAKERDFLHFRMAEIKETIVRDKCMERFKKVFL